MHTDAPNDLFMRSLGRAVARGRTVTAWAKQNDVSAEVARGWAVLPEFLEFVDKCRLQHTDRMVGKIASRVPRAIDRLAELAESSENVAVGVAAAKALIEKWVLLSAHFEQGKQFADLNARIKVLLASRAAEQNGTVRPGVGRKRSQRDLRSRRVRGLRPAPNGRLTGSSEEKD